MYDGDRFLAHLRIPSLFCPGYEDILRSILRNEDILRSIPLLEASVASGVYQRSTRTHTVEWLDLVLPREVREEAEWV